MCRSGERFFLKKYFFKNCILIYLRIAVLWPFDWFFDAVVSLHGKCFVWRCTFHIILNPKFASEFSSFLAQCLHLGVTKGEELKTKMIKCDIGKGFKYSLNDPLCKLFKSWIGIMLDLQVSLNKDILNKIECNVSSSTQLGEHPNFGFNGW